VAVEVDRVIPVGKLEISHAVIVTPPAARP